MRRNPIEVGGVYQAPDDGGVAFHCLILADLRREIGAVFCAFFAGSEAHDVDMVSRRLPMATQLVTPELLVRGVWKLVSRASFAADPVNDYIKTLRGSGFVGARIVGAGLVSEYLDTKFGLRPASAWPDASIVDRFFSHPVPVTVDALTSESGHPVRD
jgi:hypothetical protein